MKVPSQICLTLPPMEATFAYESQQKYIDSRVETDLPDGVPSSFHVSHAPASEDLTKHVEAALLTKADRTLDAGIHRELMSLVGAL
eukprot:6186305-Pleurochrysis_carterae.AAC.1